MPDPRIRLRVWRQPAGARERAGFETFEITTDPVRDTVLDLIERAWAEVDRSLVFRHACHHASCGTCAILVDGRERLPCVTSVQSVWDGHSPLSLRPLRNASVVADLAIEPAVELTAIAALPLPYVRTVEGTVRACSGADGDADVGTAERFEDCLECLACLSACPVASGDPGYLGPAVLAAAQRIVEEPRGLDVGRVIDLVDTEHGVWQCRSIWACTAVCPSNVDPARRIMDLRRRLLTADWPASQPMRASVGAGASGAGHG
jgi:succinate dehydrogenase / fumarate reductase iron-sulfur subunit